MRTFLGLIFSTWFCLGATPSNSDTRIALVIGNASYSVAPTLKNPANDANAISASLERLGFEVFLGLDQDINQFRNLIYQFSQQAKEADLALFYYAGHGLQVSGKNYLLPVDADLKSETDLDFSAIDLQLVLKQLERNATNSVVLLDACRDNPFEAELVRSMGATRSSNVLSSGLAQVETLGGALIGFATDPGAVAFDGAGRHSPFTEALLSHIETPGLEINTLMTRVRADVVGTTGQRQRPWATSSLLSEIYLAPVLNPQGAFAKSSVRAVHDGQGVPPNPANAWEKFDERFDGTDGTDIVFGGEGVDWFTATQGNDFYSGGAEWNQYNIAIEGISLDDIQWSYDASEKILKGQHSFLGTDYFDETIDNFWSESDQKWMDRTTIIASAAPFAVNVDEVRTVSADAVRALGLVTAPEAPQNTGQLVTAAAPAPRPDQAPSDVNDPTAALFSNLPAGHFRMGSTANAAESPIVEVTLGEFSMSRSEITVGQFREFIDQSGYAPDNGCFVWTENGKMRFRKTANWSAPGFDTTENMPVACVNWQDATAYADWLGSALGQPVRLPSEAELEYAIRAGTTGPYPFSEGSEAACQAVNAADASSRFKWRNTACSDGHATAAEVNALPTNAFGLTGTTGNLWEWAADCWNPSHNGAPGDGATRTTGQCTSRVLRGGSWDDPLDNLRSAYRVGIPAKRRQANVGFRVVLDR